MNIKQNDKKVIPEQLRQHGVKKVSDKTKLFETILKVKSKQFNFECGAIMGRLNINSMDRFCLRYHYNSTIPEDEQLEQIDRNEQHFNAYILSIEEFLKSSECVLTKFDIRKLRLDFDKFNK